MGNGWCGGGGGGGFFFFNDTATTEIYTLSLHDALPISRGQKHLRELTAILPDARAVMLYFINRGDCDRFAPGDSADPKYGELLRAAISAGVEVLPCRFETTPTGISYIGLAQLVL